MAYKDYYTVLGVARGASQDEISKAFRTLARRLHPDVSKEPDAEARFKELGEAYEVLKDPEKRGLYDQYGESWKAVSEGRAPPPGYEGARSDFEHAGFRAEDVGDLGSLFDQFFRGGRWSGAEPRRSHGADIESVLALPVEEAYRGGQTALSFSDPFTGESKHLTVKIPPGVREGQRIRLAGQGQPGPTPETAGDLYLRIHLRRSSRFWFDERDVHTALDVTPWEAALGATVTLMTLDGPVRLKVPAGSSSGRKIRLKGKGYPLEDESRSDLFAEIRIVVPDRLGDEERQLMEQLAKVSRFKARPHEEGVTS